MQQSFLEVQAILPPASAVNMQQQAPLADLQPTHPPLPATFVVPQNTEALPLLSPVPNPMPNLQHSAQAAGNGEVQHTQQAQQQQQAPQQAQHAQQAQHGQQAQHAQQMQQPQTGARVKASPTAGAAMPTVNLAFPQLSRLLASPSRSSSRADLFAGNESLDLNTLAKAALQKRKEQVSNKHPQVVQVVSPCTCAKYRICIHLCCRLSTAVSGFACELHSLQPDVQQTQLATMSA